MQQIIKWTLVLAVACCVSVTAQAQVPADCPNVCTHEYALCIAASCDASGNCGDCDTNDGSCGYCYVLQGQSCSYHKPCDDLKPSGNIVYSTYSEVLAAQYDFKVLTCTNPQTTSDCMDARCYKRENGKVPLRNKNNVVEQVPTAICSCGTVNGGWDRTLGGNCKSKNCSAIWSTAPVSVLGDQPACSDCDG